jgi:general stress protein CsbA
MFETLFETWWVPFVGALHVLGIAWFGGTVLFDDPRLTRWRWVGLALMLLTGVLLFAANPSRTWASTAFRIKLVLLAALWFAKPRWLVLTLWAAVIAASRGIAYF